jgi:hypothetical protein
MGSCVIDAGQSAAVREFQPYVQFTPVEFLPRERFACVVKKRLRLFPCQNPHRPMNPSAWINLKIIAQNTYLSEKEGKIEKPHEE